MSPEIVTLLEGMEAGNLMTQLALHCAPLFAGLRISAFFTLKSSGAQEAARLLEGTDICCDTLYEADGRCALFLYDKKKLADYIGEAQCRRLLLQCGYRSAAFTEQLFLLAERYAAYREGRAAFPHELGLFLGYPVEDVRGFLAYGGRRFLYAGYWKVYGKEREKRLLFARFDRARETALALVAAGAGIAKKVREKSFKKE